MGVLKKLGGVFETPCPSCGAIMGWDKQESWYSPNGQVWTERMQVCPNWCAIDVLESDPPETRFFPWPPLREQYPDGLKHDEIPAAYLPLTWEMPEGATPLHMTINQFARAYGREALLDALENSPVEVMSDGTSQEEDDG